MTMTLERLEALLDAYGAAAERWPEVERDAARRMIESSAEARRMWEDAAALDRLLDSLPDGLSSAGLASEVLAAAPRPRVRRIWTRALAAAVPLAAAAAVVLWLTTERQRVQSTSNVPIASLGEYTSPTDVLLEPYGIDVSDTVPSIGCADSQLGCPRVEPAVRPYSQRRESTRFHA
jgi:hypothetical protein